MGKKNRKSRYFNEFSYSKGGIGSLFVYQIYTLTCQRDFFLDVPLLKDFACDGVVLIQLIGAQG